MGTARRTRSIAAVLALTLSAAACGGGGGDASSGAEGDGDEGPPQRGGEVIYALEGETNSG